MVKPSPLLLQWPTPSRIRLKDGLASSTASFQLVQINARAWIAKYNELVHGAEDLLEDWKTGPMMIYFVTMNGFLC